MLSQNELANGANLMWLGTMFLTWLAVVYMFYFGEWRRSTDAGIRDSSAMFLKGACLSFFALTAHRAYWFTYIVLAERGLYVSLADVTQFRWVLPIFVLMGSIGNMMMLYPILKGIIGVNWKLISALAIAVLWMVGVMVT